VEFPIRWCSRPLHTTCSHSTSVPTNEGVADGGTHRACLQTSHQVGVCCYAFPACTHLAGCTRFREPPAPLAPAVSSLRRLALDHCRNPACFLKPCPPSSPHAGCPGDAHVAPPWAAVTASTLHAGGKRCHLGYSRHIRLRHQGCVLAMCRHSAVCSSIGQDQQFCCSTPRLRHPG
jgi:hypothetical protein